MTSRVVPTVGVLLLLLLPAIPAQAQFRGLGSISGTVTDAEGTLLGKSSGVEVAIRATCASSKDGVIVEHADSEGRWTIRMMARGQWTLTFEAKGYATIRTQITLETEVGRGRTLVAVVMKKTS